MLLEMKAQPKASASTAQSAPAPSAIRYAWITVLMVAPCFWQSRIQAGDLGSHVYTAWLARFLAGHPTPGVSVVLQSTNILFDWLLSGLLGVVGAALAQRLAVAMAVVIFVWGAFAFVRAAARREPWEWLPAILVLAYGWVFHEGFFNFYLSLGLCLWAMSIAWRRTARGLALAVPLLILAWLGHNLPALWSAAILVYVWIAERVNPSRKMQLLAIGIGGIVVMHVAARIAMVTQWYGWQFLLITGADQVHVFDGKYYLVSALVVAALGLGFVAAMRHAGARTMLASSAFHAYALTAALVAIFPTALIRPGWQVAYLADRM